MEMKKQIVDSRKHGLSILVEHLEFQYKEWIWPLGMVLAICILNMNSI